MWYLNRQPAFRPTLDVDVVLILEALSSAFTERFHEYMAVYGYHGEAIGVDGLQRPRMFRLQTQHPDVPVQIEILSRRDDVLLLPAHQTLAPLKVEDKYANLSCILMDDVYYNFLRQHVTLVEGIPLPVKAALIALKVKAYLNIREMRKTAPGGRRVPHEEEMNKHRNDVFFLLMDMVAQQDAISVPSSVAGDLQQFARILRQEDMWLPVSQSLRERRKQDKQVIRNLNLEMMLHMLRTLFHLPES